MDQTPSQIPVPVPLEKQLYDLRDDPGEKNNLAETMPDKTDEMMHLLELIRANEYPAEFFTSGEAQREVPPLSPQLLEQLQSLGYLAK